MFWSILTVKCPTSKYGRKNMRLQINIWAPSTSPVIVLFYCGKHFNPLLSSLNFLSSYSWILSQNKLLIAGISISLKQHPDCQCKDCKRGSPCIPSIDLVHSSFWSVFCQFSLLELFSESYLLGRRFFGSSGGILQFETHIPTMNLSF